jgi:hypothetical protein
MSESNVTPELKATLADVVAEQARGLGEHPEPGLLFAFREGQLTAEQEEDVREHLTCCRDCVDLLVLDPEAAPESVVDFETGRAWREMRARVRQIEAERRAARFRKRSRLFQLATAASLALMAGAFLLDFPTPPASPSAAGHAPIANVEIFDVTRSLQRGPNQPATPITVSEDDEYFTLVFVLDPRERTSYELEIVDDRGRKAWTTTAIDVREARATLALPSGFLKPGDYIVRIQGQGEGSTEVWEFPITLSYS